MPRHRLPAHRKRANGQRCRDAPNTKVETNTGAPENSNEKKVQDSEWQWAQHKRGKKSVSRGDTKGETNTQTYTHNNNKALAACHPWPDADAFAQDCMNKVL
ncbi:hypothetical protein SUGI_0519920 [Cryptomeria japonica]|nr:hypothetical protein SUGI_0519920 [Cryptomeria japonica]